MKRQFEWAGANLYDTGYLVRPESLDVPQEQNKVLILPPDPMPRENPRPDPSVTGPAFLGQAPPTSPGNLGLTLYVIGSTPGIYPTDPADVLAQVAALSGVPTPAPLQDRSTTITKANVSQLLLPFNFSRTWLLLYSPSVPQMQIALTVSTALGVTTNLAMGPGQAWFTAAALGLGPVWQGPVSIIGLTAGVAVYAWESP